MYYAIIKPRPSPSPRQNPTRFDRRPNRAHHGISWARGRHQINARELWGAKEVLGLWIEQNEGAKFWLKVINELKNRGVRDILIACCDGLKGFPEAIEAVFPQTVVQTCIVHMIRNSVRFVSYKDRNEVVRDLKPVYSAPSREEAENALTRFEDKWGRRYAMIGASWRDVTAVRGGVLPQRAWRMHSRAHDEARAGEVD